MDTPEPFQPAIAPIASRLLGHFTIKDGLTNRRKHFLYFPDDSFAVIGDLVCVSFACPAISAARQYPTSASKNLASSSQALRFFL
ncbi:MAG: hypothetical protein PHQ75_06605 [Thermoguttaceae bacterium]|nr:hypothetical protein [Thermoguttaceae bacterium]